MKKKIVFLLLPFLISCFWFGLLMKGLYFDPFGVLFKTFLSFYFQTLLVLLFLGFFASFFPLFVQAIIIAPLAGLAFFLGNLTLYGVFFALGIIIATFFLVFDVQKNRENYLKFSSSQILMPAIGRFLFFISIFLCVFFGFALHEKVKRETVIIPSGFLKETVNATPSFLKNYLYQYFEQELIRQVGQKIGIQDPEAVLQFLENQVEETTGEETIQVLFDQNITLVEEELKKQIAPYFGLAPFILPVILFLMLKVVISILLGIISLLTTLAFEIFKRIGFFKVKIEQRPIEILSLD